MTIFEPALCTVTFRSLRPAEIVPLAVQARLAAVEWAGDVHVPPGDTAAAEDAARLCREARLAVSYGSYIAPPTDNLDAFEGVLDTAIRLGATNIRIWPGTRERDSADYSQAERRAAAAAIRSMGDEAARSGVTVSLEYHPHSLTDETQSALRLIEDIGHDNVYLYWQPRPGLPLCATLDEIAQIGPHVSHIHVFAWDRERNRFALETASDYWREVISAMPETRWRGRRFAMLEFVARDDPQAFLRDATTLARIVAGGRSTAGRRAG